MGRRYTMAIGLAGVMMLAGLMSGCGRDDTPPPAPAESMPDEPAEVDFSAVDALLSEIHELMEEDRSSEAVVRLTQALDDPDFEEHAEFLFSMLIRNLIAADRHEDAREQVLSIIPRQPMRAYEGFAILLYTMRDDTAEGVAEALAWCDAILDLADDAELIRRVWMAKTELLLQAGDRDLLLAAAPRIAALDDEVTAAIVASVARHAVDAAVRPLVLVFLEAAATDSRPATARAVTFGLLDTHWRDGALDAAMDVLTERYASLEDSRAAGVAIRLVRGYAEAGESDAVERVIQFVFEHGESWPRTRDQAGATWIRLAAQADDPSVFMDRVEALSDAGGSVRSLSSAFSAGFYMAMQSGNDALRQRVDAFNRQLLAREDLNDHTREMLLTQQLDSAFYRDAFEEALEILEAGVPNQDEAWHQNLIGKVSAHVALMENRHEDAITAFQRHIDSVKQWTDPILNPETGRFVIKEMVIGFNEKRIGDIYADLPGRDHDAAEAYARARAWYAQALELLEPDTPEYAEAKGALAALDVK